MGRRGGRQEKQFSPGSLATGFWEKLSLDSFALDEQLSDREPKPA